MSPALGAATAQRPQTTPRFEGRLGVSGLAPPEFGSPTDGLPPLATLPRVASPLPEQLVPWQARIGPPGSRN